MLQYRTKWIYEFNNGTKLQNITEGKTTKKRWLERNEIKKSNIGWKVLACRKSLKVGVVTHSSREQPFIID